SATEIDVCDYYQGLTESEVSETYPWLYDTHYVKPTITIGSDKFDCPQSPSDQAGGAFIAHNHKFEYDGLLKSIKWVADEDTSSEDFTFYLLRPQIDTLDCEFDVVTAFDLSEYVAGDED